ncbi:FtsX-like permease family protein [Actinopolymorpha singaporensis]|uniref:FtsX-like permease family protein n=1 Tax=Actinopolymorpha singaporensis TaxID=117157 RepID=A0A1H1Q932_9ACTN|nr:FtsX-like permease family protein [Actinopolymorpha singaporensis]SDS19992.1 hypothetical protein SAMN04489717_1932 [Actinopolymorpha singaporensis]
MHDVRLVLRGMWFRRGVSLAVLVIASLVVGAAVTGPLFLRAAGESVLRDTLAQALPIGRTMNDHLAGSVGSNPLPQVVHLSSARLRQVPTLNRLLGSPVESMQVEALAGAPGTTGNPAPLVYRAEFCSHVRIVQGRCAERAGSVIVSASALASQHWHVGQTLMVNGRRVTVAGVYAPLDPTGDYWAGHPYFTAYSGSGVAGDMGGSLDAILAPLATVRAQPGDTAAMGAVDRYLDLDKIRLTDLPALKHDLLAYSGSSGLNGNVSDSAMLSVLMEATEVKDKLTVPVLLVEVQLLVLCWLILFLVVANASEARGPEVALAKLRGVPPGRTVAFGLLDTLVLVALAVPIGLVLALAGVTGLAALNLAPGTPVVLTAASGLAALGAGLGAATAAVLAGSRTLRRPVVEQWRRATRRARSRPWAIDVVVGLASIGGLIVLARRGAVGAEPGSTSVLALLAPGLVVLAAALVGSRVLPGLCRAGFGLTRRQGGLGGFLAVRHIGRRPTTLRLALVLSVAFGLVAFATDAWSVARANAHDRAWTEVGAAAVLTVTPPPGKDLADIVDRLDPSGRQATAVSAATEYRGSDQLQLLGVQPERFARIAFWRGDFGPAALPRLTERLTPRVASPVKLAGDRIRVAVFARHVSAARPPVLVADVAQAEGGLAPISLGAVHEGANTLTAELPCPAGGCRLAGVHVDRPAATFYPIGATLELNRVSVRTGTGWRSVPAHLSDGQAWRPTGEGATAATPGTSGLTLTMHAGDADTPTWRITDAPAVLPALAAGPTPADGVRIAGLNGQSLPVRAVAAGPAMPGVGAHGVIVDRTYAQRAVHGFNTVTSETVWLAPSALDTFPRRLEAAGVAILDTSSAAHQTALYERQGPALAILLFLAGAGLGALLAAGGAVLHLHLTGRRRTYELAAMSALGLRRATLFTALYAEQSLLMVFGIGVGAAAGIVGAVLAVPVVPEFADVPAAPPMLYGLHSGPVLVTVAAVVAVLAVVVAASSINLLRTSRFDQLREAPA